MGIDVYHAPARSSLAPLLLFSPAFGTRAESYRALLREIASHGFMIVAVTPDPGRENDSNFTQTVYDRAGELVALLDAIDSASAQHDAVFQRADLGNAGILGHSIGGATAAEVLYRDARFRRGMDLDGTVFGHAVTAGVRQPFLMLFAELGWLQTFPKPPDEWVVDHDAQRVNELSLFEHSPNTLWVTVRGLRHTNFTDDALSAGMHRVPEALGIRLDAQRTVQMAAWYVVKFFSAASNEELARPPFREVVATKRRTT